MRAPGGCELGFAEAGYARRERAAQIGESECLATSAARLVEVQIARRDGRRCTVCFRRAARSRSAIYAAARTMMDLVKIGRPIGGVGGMAGRSRASVGPIGRVGRRPIKRCGRSADRSLGSAGRSVGRPIGRVGRSADRSGGSVGRSVGWVGRPIGRGGLIGRGRRRGRAELERMGSHSQLESSSWKSRHLRDGYTRRVCRASTRPPERPGSLSCACPCSATAGR